jgi:cytochrome c-type biogenesis protein CcmH
MADLARERPDDAQVWSWLGTARAANADLLGAAEAFRRAVELKPDSAGDWESFGVVLVELDRGRVGEDASRAFRRALELDPATAGARYYLGREALQQGRAEEGLSTWRALAASLDAADPRRAALEQEIAAAERPAASAPSLDDPDTAARVRGMVEGLAARLEESPDDPQGWARLIRSYRVLGDETRRAEALARARTLFEGRPQDLALVEDAARFEAPR